MISFPPPLGHPLALDNGHVRVFAETRFLRHGKVAMLRDYLVAER